MYDLSILFDDLKFILKSKETNVFNFHPNEKVF